MSNSNLSTKTFVLCKTASKQVSKPSRHATSAGKLCLSGSRIATPMSARKGSQSDLHNRFCQFSIRVDPWACEKSSVLIIGSIRASLCVCSAHNLAGTSSAGQQSLLSHQMATQLCIAPRAFVYTVVLCCLFVCVSVYDERECLSLDCTSLFLCHLQVWWSRSPCQIPEVIPLIFGCPAGFMLALRCTCVGGHL